MENGEVCALNKIQRLHFDFLMVLMFFVLTLLLGPIKSGRSEEENKMKWLCIDTTTIPTGIVEVDVKINDNGAEYDSVMFAGHMGTEIKNEGDTVQPTLGWAIALKFPNAEKSKRIKLV